MAKKEKDLRSEEYEDAEDLRFKEKVKIRKIKNTKESSSKISKEKNKLKKEQNGNT